MIPTGTQAYEPGDIVALPFDSAEAAYIAETIRSLRGVAVKDGDGERGIWWSDMAILLRSVKANGEPITDALTAAGIPYVVAGMNNLFGTAKAEAARRREGRERGVDPVSWTGLGLAIPYRQARDLIPDHRQDIEGQSVHGRHSCEGLAVGEGAQERPS